MPRKSTKKETKGKSVALPIVSRPPVVVIMGHVDHGKTSLLDAIRETKVAEHEHGGITQHIGAYQAQGITFIDTPGHAAFTEMRARGGKIADIVVLVVAANDGVMPQTKEAIAHAKAASVPIIVAINKIDLPEADPENVKKQLSEEGVFVEGWGGDVVCAEVSAKTKKGLDHLLEMIKLVAEMQELKSEPAAPFEGVVVESRLDTRRGVLATILVRKGTLRKGDTVFVGLISGKIKAMLDFQGKTVEEASPSMPVEVLGFPEVLRVGEVVSLVKSEKVAEKETASLVDFQKEAPKEGVKVLNLILKADVTGSLEAIEGALLKLETEGAQVLILHAATGEVSDSDVLLASASKAVVLAFNVHIISKDIAFLAKDKKVEIRPYTIIYELLEDIEKALKGILVEEPKKDLRGKAQVLKLFPLPSGDVVVGCMVVSGRLKVGDKVKIRRVDVEVPIAEAEIDKMKQKKEFIEVTGEGLECGLLLKPTVEVKAGDTIEVG